MWQKASGGVVSGQPILANGLLYWAAWDGYEHATSLDGGEGWSAYLGRTSAPGCEPSNAGPAGAATAASLGGKPVLYVAGGSADYFALDALTGARLWRTVLGTPPYEYIWGSPALFGGSLFVAVSAFGECGQGPGQLFKLNAVTGAVEGRFATVAAGCAGGGLWGSPAVDQQAGIVYVASGDPGECSQKEANAIALLAIRASDMRLVDSWQVPAADQSDDSDFGSTPTLFRVEVAGHGRDLVGLANKNGYYYAFQRGHLNAGPVWRTRVARAGSCPYCGDGSISASAWNGESLLVAGGATAIGGADCAGSLRALDPSIGRPIWELCLTAGPVLAAVVSAPGVAIAGDGPELVTVDTATGRVLERYREPDPKVAFLAPPALGSGVVYAASTTRLLALAA